MRQQTHDSYEWIVDAVQEEGPHVYSLLLRSVNERPPFIAGQYLTVRLPNFEPAEGKSYSISSGVHEDLVRLTVKEMGAFSKSLTALRSGDTLHTSAPYGFFYPERTPERDLIFIAGGIGITPYISIMNTYCHQNYAGRISLFYSNQTLAQTIFKSDLDTLCHTHQNVTVIYHITREPLTDTLYRMGRLSGNIICEGIQHPQTSDFFISGSIDFTKTMWKGLRNAGIKDAQLYTEGFF